MQRVVRILYWQWAFLFVAIITTALSSTSLTGMAVQQTEDTTPFAPPYDTFTDNLIISLEHHQVDNTTFHITISIDTSSSHIYSTVYYYTKDGWRPRHISGTNDWIRNAATISVEGPYSDIPLREGDDFFVGVWVCKGIDDNWHCGCKEQDDCGYWHVQGIDLEQEGKTIIPCTDEDGDGYGSQGEESCFFNSTDCDDNDAAVNPGMTEVAYNGKDDDCNPSTPDDDLDGDGFMKANDCDDLDASINPLAVDICDDGIDQDCDGNDRTCEQCGEGGIPATGCVCADTSSWDGFCCDNTYQTVPCGTPEVIFYDGFESGTGNTWAYLNPNSRVNSDLSYTGRFSLDLIYSAGGTLKTNQYAETPLAPYQHLFHRYFLYFEEDYRHGAGGVALATFGKEEWPITQSARQWQGDWTRGRLFLQIGGESHPTDKIVQNGQWYCIEAEALAGDSNGLVRLWVDGSLVAEHTGLSFAGGEGLDYLKQGGQYSDVITDTIHIYVDNVVVSRQRVGCS